MATKWTEDMDRKLRSLCRDTRESYNSIAKKMGLTGYIVKQRIKTLDIKYTKKLGPPSTWTEDEIKLLKKYIEEKIISTKEIGGIINKPTKEIWAKLKFLGIRYDIKNSGIKYWSKEETNWIKENHHKFCLRDASKILNRTITSLKKYALKIKIKFKKQENKADLNWSKEEDEWMFSNYSVNGIVGSAKILKKTTNQVVTRARKLKISIKPEHKKIGLSYKRSFIGYYNCVLFRSLHELWFMFELDKRGVEYKSAERLFSIPYEINGKKKTYRPDFIVGKTLYEVKPHQLFSDPTVIAKKIAAEKFCKKMGFEYKLFSCEPAKEDIKNLYLSGAFKIHEKCLERFKKYLKL